MILGNVLRQILTASEHSVFVPIQIFALGKAKDASVLWSIAVGKSDVAATVPTTPRPWPSVDDLDLSFDSVAGIAVEMRLGHEQGPVNNIAIWVFTDFFCVVYIRAVRASDVVTSSKVTGGALPP